MKKEVRTIKLPLTLPTRSIFPRKNKKQLMEVLILEPFLISRMTELIKAKKLQIKKLYPHKSSKNLKTLIFSQVKIFKVLIQSIKEVLS